MGKKQAREQAEAQESLVGDLEQEIADLQDALGEANQRAERSARDADYYRQRETRRATIEHHERQQKLKQAERAKRLERVEQITAGRLPLDGAESVSITHEGDEVFIDVTVKLTKPEHQAVQDYLSKPKACDALGSVIDRAALRAAYFEGSSAHSTHVDYVRDVQDRVNKIVAGRPGYRGYYIY